MPDTLNANQSLKENDSLTSQDGRFTLVLQADGNLVQYWSGGAARWATNTAGKPGIRADMQADGNFVLYAAAGPALWASGTCDHPGAFITLQNDGNLVIYNQARAPLWASNTGTRCAHDKETVNYRFRLDKFHIDTTRARNNDTDVVAFAVKIGDQMLGPQIKRMGDVNNGDHDVSLTFGPLAIASTAVEVGFNYQILNSGHQGDADVSNLLNQGADYLAKGSTASANPLVIAAAWLGKFTLGWLFANCDGPVALDQIRYTGATLDELTFGSMHSETRRYRFTSQDGCGDDSDYKVTWSVGRQ